MWITSFGRVLELIEHLHRAKEIYGCNSQKPTRGD